MKIKCDILPSFSNTWTKKKLTQTYITTDFGENMKTDDVQCPRIPFPVTYHRESKDNCQYFQMGGYCLNT